MLFNSYEFIFAFLPATLAVFYFCGQRSRDLALGWLVLASLFFYAWWRPINVLIIAPSIVVNYLLARALLRLAAQPARVAAARWTLFAGIAFNVCFLGYFKYINFLGTVAHDLTGRDFALVEVVLPLGISFITFQKIAFLIDVYGRRVESFTFRGYALFVLFFPQLIAGPIVHYREMMPQFEKATCRFDGEGLAVGVTMFVFGLFKKVVLADSIASYVTPLYDAAAGGSQVTLIPAWIAAVGFTLQIYFDFSGYTDMALGIARCFGVRLPANFDSPLKATSIIDFWLRWHMTLTRFLTAYLYNPLVLSLTRRRMTKGRPALTGRATTPGAFFALLAAPTLLTMFISGLWHGAGYLFLAWGVLHGVYLCINHAWRIYGPRARQGKPERRRWGSAFVLTFVSVATAMVLFRSTNGTAAKEILEGMFGLNGVGLPAALVERLGALAGKLHLTAANDMSLTDFVLALSWVISLLAAALLLPNTLQILERFTPALTTARATAAQSAWLRRVLSWSPSFSWAIALGLLAVAAVIRIGGQSEFLYWQF
ncbi:MAG TPA: MBOAT family O-acyltransferase [Burkholderiaceae bacterium]|nr:MBOAT family O-acyltransferase [Burkholderiaceae bacterium]